MIGFWAVFIESSVEDNTSPSERFRAHCENPTRPCEGERRNGRMSRYGGARVPRRAVVERSRRVSGYDAENVPSRFVGEPRCRAWEHDAGLLRPRALIAPLAFAQQVGAKIKLQRSISTPNAA